MLPPDTESQQNTFPDLLNNSEDLLKGFINPGAVRRHIRSVSFSDVLKFYRLHYSNY
jgi:hypothetical protein